ncbi:MAG TPA: response regulator [Methylomirabilota bacterium]|jgi:CheY-like chemotaxis protein|nr:response regulator [Methylomirabilota bacterium]
MSQTKSNAHSAGRNGSTLLFVVDDEPMLLELATVILEPLGYTVKTFRDPESALQAFTAAKPRPAIILTDYAMHTMNGMELIEACRRLHPRQKILLLSGTVDQQVYRNSAFKPDRFLAKPYQAKQLTDAVKELLAV